MSTKNRQSREDLRKYQKDPEDFFNVIEEEYHSSYRIMNLIEFTNRDPKFLKDISSFYFPESPLDILKSKHSVDTRLCMLNAAYIDGMRYTELTTFYDELVDFNKYGLSLTSHSLLISKLVPHLASVGDPTLTQWLCNRVVDLTGLYREISEHTKEIPVDILTSILPIYSVLQRVPMSQITVIHRSILEIMTTIYGNRTEQIISTGTALGVIGNPDYWLSCVEVDKHMQTECALPEIC